MYKNERACVCVFGRNRTNLSECHLFTSCTTKIVHLEFTSCAEMDDHLYNWPNTTSTERYHLCNPFLSTSTISTKCTGIYFMCFRIFHWISASHIIHIHHIFHICIWAWGKWVVFDASCWSNLIRHSSITHKPLISRLSWNHGDNGNNHKNEIRKLFLQHNITKKTRSGVVDYVLF